jgi:hypothetical protein
LLPIRYLSAGHPEAQLKRVWAERLQQPTATSVPISAWPVSGRHSRPKKVLRACLDRLPSGPKGNGAAACGVHLSRPHSITVWSRVSHSLTWRRRARVCPQTDTFEGTEKEARPPTGPPGQPRCRFKPTPTFRSPREKTWRSVLEGGPSRRRPSNSGMPGEPGGGFTFRAEPGRKGERLGSFLTSRGRAGLSWPPLAKPGHSRDRRHLNPTHRPRTDSTRISQKQ